MCKVDGKMVKPDKMQTEDDEPKAAADDVLGADRVLRERKHPMEKFLEDAESSLNPLQICPDMAAMAARYDTPQPETPPPKEKKRKAADTDTIRQETGRFSQARVGCAQETVGAALGFVPRLLQGDMLVLDLLPNNSGRRDME